MLKVKVMHRSTANIFQMVTDRKYYYCHICAFDRHIYIRPEPIQKVKGQGHADCDCEYLGN